MSRKAIRAKDLLNLAAATKSQDDENISKVKKVLENNYGNTQNIVIQIQCSSTTPYLFTINPYIILRLS